MRGRGANADFRKKKTQSKDGETRHRDGEMVRSASALRESKRDKAVKKEPLLKISL